MIYPYTTNSLHHNKRDAVGKQVVLQFALIKHSETLMSWYDLNLCVSRQDSLSWQAFNLVPYYDHSKSKPDDNSLVLVRKHYPDGNLLPFVINDLLPMIRADNDTSQEAVAIYSWCKFLDQISVPLRYLNFGRVALDDIFIEEGDESYDYVLGRIENQFIEEDESAQIAVLLMTAWRYYTILSYQHEVVMDEEDGIMHAPFMNTFAFSSKVFWSSNMTMTAEERYNAEVVARGVLLRTMNFMASVQFGQPRVHKCIEYRIASCTRRFAFPCEDAEQQPNWHAFVTELGDICGDWIDSGNDQ